MLLFSSFLKSVDRFPVCSPEIKLLKKLPTWLFSKMFFIDTFHKIKYSTSKLYLLDKDHLFLVTLCSNAVHHPLMSRCPLSSTCPNITSVSSLSHVLLLPVLLSSHTWASPFSCHLTSQCLQLSKNQYLWIKKNRIKMNMYTDRIDLYTLGLLLVLEIHYPWCKITLKSTKYACWHIWTPHTNTHPPLPPTPP